MNNVKRLIITGSVFAFMAVALGAFGAHSLKNVLDDYGMMIWEKAVFYQMIHALAIIFCGVLQNMFLKINFKNAAYSFIAGNILFSGSLYILAISDIKVLGAVTPLGGISFLLGWGLIIYNLTKKTKA